MSRRTSRPRRPPHTRQDRPPRTVTAESSCPCGRPAAYGECCGRFHEGRAAAPTAEALMRSRFSAFAVGDEAYLLRSWHPDTRPPRVEFDPGQRWQRLEILGTTEGSAFHARGTVTFRAHSTYRGEPAELEERSTFERHAGAWVYVDGVSG